MRTVRAILAIGWGGLKESYRERAGEMARKIKKENGITRAIELIEAMFPPALM